MKLVYFQNWETCLSISSAALANDEKPLNWDIRHIRDPICSHRSNEQITKVSPILPCQLPVGGSEPTNISKREFPTNSRRIIVPEIKSPFFERLLERDRMALYDFVQTEAICFDELTNLLCVLFYLIINLVIKYLTNGRRKWAHRTNLQNKLNNVIAQNMIHICTALLSLFF